MFFSFFEAFKVTRPAKKSARICTESETIANSSGSTPGRKKRANLIFLCRSNGSEPVSLVFEWKQKLVKITRIRLGALLGEQKN